MANIFSCTVEDCFKAYTTRPNMLRHIRLHHYMAEPAEIKVTKLRLLRSRVRGDGQISKLSQIHWETYKTRQHRHKHANQDKYLISISPLKLTTYYTPGSQEKFDNPLSDQAHKLPTICEDRQAHGIVLPLAPNLAI